MVQFRVLDFNFLLIWPLYLSRTLPDLHETKNNLELSNHVPHGI